jgi:hypothetical protein
MGLPLRQLSAWIGTNNDVIGKINEANRQRSQK